MWSLCPFSPVHPPRPCCMFRVIAQTLRLSPSHRERVRMYTHMLCMIDFGPWNLVYQRSTLNVQRPAAPHSSATLHPRRIGQFSRTPSSQLPPRLAHRRLYFYAHVVLVVQPLWTPEVTAQCPEQYPYSVEYTWYLKKCPESPSSCISPHPSVMALETLSPLLDMHPLPYLCLLRPCFLPCLLRIRLLTLPIRFNHLWRDDSRIEPLSLPIRFHNLWRDTT